MVAAFVYEPPRTGFMEDGTIRLPGFDLRDLTGLGLWIAVTAAGLLPTIYGLEQPDPEPEVLNDLGWLRGRRSRTMKEYYRLTVGGAHIDPPRPTLVLRGIDDEAGMALAAGSIANRILTIFMSAFLNMTVAFIVVCICIIGAATLAYIDQRFDWLRSPIRELISSPQVFMTAQHN
jgi:hypothetical protein